MPRTRTDSHRTAGEVASLLPERSDEMQRETRSSLYVFTSEGIAAAGEGERASWWFVESSEPFVEMRREHDTGVASGDSPIRGILGHGPKRFSQDIVLGLIADLASMIEADVASTG